MELLKNILPILPEKVTNPQKTELEAIVKDVERMNSTEGDLVGYNCKKCKNRGYYAVVEDGAMCMARCSCMEVRSSLKRMAASGINEEYILETFDTSEPWQKHIFDAAMKFLENPEGSWFFTGGQVGAGKTHLCTGLVRKLLDRGMPARYMCWRDDIVTIKANIMNAEEYANLVEPLKNVKVLYIDDLFKTNSKEPTTAEINVAFEILNARYNRKGLITIISTEFFIDEIVDIDQAVGSRIFEKSKQFQNNIGRIRTRNYRLKTNNRI